MSQAELQRFAAAVQADPALAESYGTAATPAELAARLRADGYDIGDGELAAAHRGGSELSDEQLDGVSGGFVVATVMANLFALGLGGALVGAVAGIVADSARRGTLPKA
ncbi:Nif11-like leader peptide family RiPP precursor [Azospirillum agricola]|uniref:Nif11-like leader peptide family RiPP precursor n=1 Tax=Azospirillum agricola TaxID=1720247 RepID=UPI000A0F09A6|nr:Nif11-like leader peptide family RiPP precursor [Azospirillum agricola]SMH28696.1 nif11-like leader peptide domain-containing protein [Azospirillum lipoferum]